jgi:hypothetical protein
MNHLCPVCAKPFTHKEVLRTDEMLPGRKYFGWNSRNHYCPHCKALLEYIKPVAQPYIDVALFLLFVANALTIRPMSSLFRPPALTEVLLVAAALALIYLRYYIGKTKGRYVQA